MNNSQAFGGRGQVCVQIGPAYASYKHKNSPTAQAWSIRNSTKNQICLPACPTGFRQLSSTQAAKARPRPKVNSGAITTNRENHWDILRSVAEVHKQVKKCRNFAISTVSQIALLWTKDSDKRFQETRSQVSQVRRDFPRHANHVGETERVYIFTWHAMQ